jgi:hypothetical protein
MMQQEIVQAGTPQAFSGGLAVRLSPISGQAAFPRTVKVGTDSVYFDGPGWKPWLVRPGAEITVPAMVLPFAAPASMLAPDPEQWLVEVATECVELETQSQGKVGAQQLVSSEAAIWDSNKLSPFIDTRPFRQVDLYVVTRADGKTAGGNFWVLTADMSGGSRTGGSAHVLNNGTDNTTMRATMVRGGFTATAMDDSGAVFGQFGPFVFLAYNTQGVVGKLVRFEAWGYR